MYQVCEECSDAFSVFLSRWLQRNTETTTSHQNSEVCGVTLATPTAGMSSPAPARPTWKLSWLTRTWQSGWGSDILDDVQVGGKSLNC